MITNKIKIPNRFKLFGQTIEVTKETKQFLGTDHVGRADYRQGTITLLADDHYAPMSKQGLEATFFHELFHHMVSVAGYHELASDEHFIDLMANLLHQALTTMEYDKETTKGTKIKKGGKK